MDIGGPLILSTTDTEPDLEHRLPAHEVLSVIVGEGYVSYLLPQKCSITDQPQNSGLQTRSVHLAHKLVGF